MTRLCCVGVNHKTAPVELREQLAFSKDAIARALPQLLQRDGVREAVVLSTCNRVEIYAAGDADVAQASIAAFLRETFGTDGKALDDHLFYKGDDEALQHLFRVAAALDAVVVGEPQILGQVKEAFFVAVNAGATGSETVRAFHRAFSTAKRVRTETKISAAAQNVASAGVDLAATIFGDLSGLKVVLVGAGDMGELAAKHFAKHGAHLTIVNRTIERAKKLADETAPMEALPRLLADVDVVLTATGASGFVVTAEQVRAVSKQRRYRPLLIVDISVPRNADPKIAELDGCYVYDVDDLSSVVDDNLSRRQGEADKAQAIVDEELDKARRARKSERAVPLIKALREKAQAIATAEAEKTLSVFGDVSERQRKSVQAMANAVVSKLLHEPMTRLKGAAAADADAHSVELLHAAATLFGLDDHDRRHDTPQDNDETRAALAEAAAAESASSDAAE